MSVGRTLARAGLIVSAAFLVSRILGWGRFVVIGNLFSKTDQDILYAAFRIPDLIFQLVAAGALSSALIPIVSGLLATDRQDRAWRVVSTVANLVLVALLVLAAVMFVAAPAVVPLTVPGFSEAATDRTVELTQIMLASPIFLALGAVATSVLNAQGQFGAASVAPLVYNLAIIGGALFLAPTMGIVGVAIGVVCGAVGHVLVQVPPLRQIGFRYRPRIDAADAAARQAVRLMAPRALGLGAGQITFLVTTALATLQGAGALAAFTYAFTLLQIPIGLIGVPLGVVLFPSLSREAAKGNLGEFVMLVTRALRLLVFVMLPVAALLAILRLETVVLLFGYGQLGVDSIVLIAQTLLAFSVGLLAHALIAVLARAFYAQQDTVTPVLAAVGAVIVNTTLAIALAGPLGLPGIALAIAIAAWLEAGALLLVLRHRIVTFRVAEIGAVALRTVLATIPAAIVGIVVRQVVGPALIPDPASIGIPGLPSLVAAMVIVTGAFAVTFAAAAAALRIAELPSIVGLMVSAFRRPRAT